MAMDAIFRFDEQEFVSDPVVLSHFFHEAVRGRDSMRFFGIHMGKKCSWRTDFVPWLRQRKLVRDDMLTGIKQLVDSVILQELNAKRRNPQYKSISLRSMLYDKYDANVFVRNVRQSSHEEEPVSDFALDKSRSLSYEEMNSSLKGVVVNGTEHVDELDSSKPTCCIMPVPSDGFLPINKIPSQSQNLLVYNPYEDMSHEPNVAPDASGEFAANWDHNYTSYQGPFIPLSSNNLEPPELSYSKIIAPAEALYSLTIPQSDGIGEFTCHSDNNAEFEENPPLQRREEIWGCDLEAPEVDITRENNRTATPHHNGMILKEEKLNTNATLHVPVLPQCGTLQPAHIYSLPTDGNNDQHSFPDDIVVEVAIFIGYPRPLEKHEIRLGRLMKVLDRFLVLGSNTLKDLKKVIDCTSDYQVFDDVSDCLVSSEGFCKNRFPSSFFFIHDTFYIDLQPKGAQDITVEIRRWASERKIADIKVADMNTTRIMDVTCRLGAPYLYNHVGACEHLVIFTRAALRDAAHPSGSYPIPIYERNFRRIACAGCKEETAEWVVWEHECMPCFTQFLCDSCYNEFNFDKSGRKLFDFKAAPCYDRRNRRAGPVELENMDIFKEDIPAEPKSF